MNIWQKYGDYMQLPKEAGSVRVILSLRGEIKLE